MLIRGFESHPLRQLALPGDPKPRAASNTSAAFVAKLPATIHVASYAFSWPPVRPEERLDLGITVVALIGLFGYTHARRIAFARLWMLWAFVFPGWNLLFHFVLDGVALEEWPVWGFLHVILLPTYAALFLYGYRSRAVWGDPEAPPLVYREG